MYFKLILIIRGDNSLQELDAQQIQISHPLQHNYYQRKFFKIITYSVEPSSSFTSESSFLPNLFLLATEIVIYYVNIFFQRSKP